MLLNINPQNPSQRKVKRVVDCLKNGGIIIYPTDTLYGIGCSIDDAKAVERVCALKGIKPNKSNLSFVCHDLSHLANYTLPFEKWIYKMMNRLLPGPYTFVLRANNKVPKLFKSGKKTVGIRVPDNNIARQIVRELGSPILSTSLKVDDDVLEYPTNPELIYEQYRKSVDMVVGGGMGNVHASTVVDCTGSQPEVLREGFGKVGF